MLIELVFFGLFFLLMPAFPSFIMTKLLFAATGASFVMIKASVLATIGIITNDKKQHASFMNSIEPHQAQVSYLLSITRKSLRIRVK